VFLNSNINGIKKTAQPWGVEQLNNQTKLNL
jgi:hypothetical protein